MGMGTREDKERAAMGGVFCCRYDSDWTLVRADESLYRFLGYTREEFREKFHDKMSGVIHPDDMKPMFETVERQLRTGNVIFNENRLIKNGGAVRWIWIAAELMQNREDGEFFYCMFFDITHRVERGKRLAERESRYDLIMRQTLDTIFEWNCRTGEAYYSPNFERKFGYRPPEKGPEFLLENGLVHPDDRSYLERCVEQMRRGEEGFAFECRVRKEDGKYLWVRINTVPIQDEEGNPGRVLGLISDIQAQKQSILEAERQARRDPLTNLYNHKATETLISRYLDAGQGTAALIVIDVDNFKGVNDTLGHIYGDALLCDLSDQLKRLFRASDVIGRVGGDEFVVFMQDLSQKETVNRKAAEVQEVFHRTLVSRGVRYEITGSIGAAFFPEDGTTYQELFEKADMAMYHSKNQGKNQFTLFGEGILTDKVRPRFWDGHIDQTEEMPKNLRGNMVEYLFRIFLENPDVEKAIPLLLDLLGNQYRLDRAYIYEQEDGAEQMHCTFEWCGGGVRSLDYVKPDHMTEAPGQEFCRKWFEAREAACGLLCPMRESSRIAGLVGYERMTGPQSMQDEERYTLSLASEAISLALMRTRKQEQLNEQEKAAYRSDFLNRNIPGGMLGSYREAGFPLYFINERMLQYLGYEDEAAFDSAVGGLIINCIYSEDRELVCREMERQIRERGEYELIYRLVKKDGSHIWVKDIGRPTQAEDGRDATISLCIDVTEQTALTNQLELYRKAARGAAFTVRMDEDFTLIYGNDIYYNLHEYTEEEMRRFLNNKCASYIHPEDLPQVRRLLGEALLQGKTEIQWEMRVVTGKGNLRWLLSTGTFEYQDGESVLNGFLTDITELQQLRQKIAHNEQIYRIALQQTGTSVWEYDLSARTIRMMGNSGNNHECPDRLQNVPESLIESGRIHPFSVEELRSLYRKLYEGEKRVQADILTLKSDGSGWWWQRITYTTLFDEQGNPVRAVAVGEDITRQKEAEIRYQQELQLRYTLSDGLLASSRVNLTKNRVEFLQLSGSPVTNPPEGMTYGDMLELGLASITNANDRERYFSTFAPEALFEAFRNHVQDVSMEYRRKGEGGRLFWASATLRLIPDAVSGDLYAYGNIRNIDSRKSIELALIKRAEKDPVTNLYSRETAVRMMEEALIQAEKRKSGYVMMIFSVENFIRITNLDGYAAAADVLRELAELLSLEFGPEQIDGRFYEDEVAALLGSRPPLEEVRSKVVQICRAMEREVLLSDAQVPVIVRAGIVSADQASDFPALYEKARTALELARSTSERCHMISWEEMDEEQREVERMVDESVLLPEGGADSRLILLRCAYLLTSSIKFSNAVTGVLKNVAEYYGADRAYLLLFERESRPEQFFEWRKGPSSPEDGAVGMRKEEIARAAGEAGLSDAVPLRGPDRQALGWLGLEHPSGRRDKKELLEPVCHFITNELVKRMMQERQQFLSYHDSLTGLLNRNSFVEFCGELREESLISLGVVSVDINGLKRMNARYGSRFGDDMVRLTADSMKKAFPSGRLYRFAGDEFLAICENLSREAFMDQIAALRALMAEPQHCISIGFVWADADIRLDVMLRHADERMMIAKKEYHKTLDTMTKGYDPALFKRLTAGMEQGAYRMFLQPKADLRTGEIVGAEALVRCYDPKNGLLAPDKFVPMLEREGLIRYIDLFMFEVVCRTLADWRRTGKKILPLSLNFSRSTLLEERLIDTMEEIRSRYGIEQTLLEIEITESLGEMERDTVAYIGRQIREKGYLLSLDDFGAQYSNIAVLSIMKLDVLKVDKTLVSDLLSNRSTKIIMRNFLQSCRQLGIKSVAEGVETEEQIQILCELGCDYAQGYYFNKPIPLKDFEETYLR